MEIERKVPEKKNVFFLDENFKVKVAVAEKS
jgi:hypothetical protein